MAEKLTTFYEFHQKVDAVLVLKHIFHIDKEWMVHLKENILLHGYICKLVVFYNKVFSDAFHRIKNLCLLVFNKEHLAKRSFSDPLFYFKVCK